MKRKSIIIAIAVLVVIVGGIMLVGNRQSNPITIVTETNTAEYQEPTTEAILPTNTASVSQADGEGENEAVESEEVNHSPTPRVGLVGTDPATVNLASGEIQLVEFFAFW